MHLAHDAWYGACSQALAIGFSSLLICKVAVLSAKKMIPGPPDGCGDGDGCRGSLQRSEGTELLHFTELFLI